MIAPLAVLHVVPLWEIPIFISMGFLMIWSGEVLGAWLVASGLPKEQKVIRWSLYSIPITIWAVMKVHRAFGIVPSLLIALAIIPGLVSMLVWDKPPRNKVN